MQIDEFDNTPILTDQDEASFASGFGFEMPAGNSITSIGLGGLQPVIGSTIPPVTPNGMQAEPTIPDPTVEQLLDATTTSYQAYNRATYRIPDYSPYRLLKKYGYNGIDELTLSISAYVRAINLKRYAILYKQSQTLPQVNSAAVTPDNPRYDAANKMADFCRYAISNIYDDGDKQSQSIRQVEWYLSMAIHYGWSAAEKQYRYINDGPYKGLLGLRKIIHRIPRQITFNIDPYTNAVKSLNNFTPVGGWQSYLPMEKFILYTYRPHEGLPFGVGDWQECFKHVMAIEELTRNWNVGLQKHGVGFLKVEVDNPSQDYMKNVQTILSQSANGNPLIVPRGLPVELMQMPSGALEVFEQALRYHEDQIVKAVLGQSLTTGQGAGSSSYALGSVHEDTQEYIFAHARHDMEHVIEQQLYRQLITVNFGEEFTDCIPKHSLGAFHTEERTMLAQCYTNLIQNGVLNSQEPFIRESLGMPPASDDYPLTLPIPQLTDPVPSSGASPTI